MTDALPECIISPPGDDFKQRYQWLVKEYERDELEHFKVVVGELHSIAAVTKDRKAVKLGQCWKLLDAAIAAHDGFEPGVNWPPKQERRELSPFNLIHAKNGHRANGKAATVPATTHTPNEHASVVKRLADKILADGHFARDPGGRLYRYEAGVYKPTGESFIKHSVKALLEEWHETTSWSSHRAEEVIEYIRVDTPELWERPPADTINVINGLLDVVTHQLRDHSPTWLSPVQLPVNYDPKATCPEWDKFVAQVFPADAQQIAFEIPASLMTPDTSKQKAIITSGEGSNGKSTYLAAAMAFIGKRNVSALSLHKLEQDKFAVARLVGKLANICADLPSAHLAGTSIFKALTGGDSVTAEYKYRDSFDFLPYARLVFSANTLPRSEDASHAFFRRWLVVPFARTFEGTEQIPRPVLDARLSDPRELSGVLNRALAVLPSLRANGFTESESMRAAWVDFRRTTDPLAVWLDDATAEEPSAVVPKRDMLFAYNHACELSGRPRMTGTAFGLALRRLRPGLEECQRTVDGKVAWCWAGLALKPADDSLTSRTSRGSRGSLYCLNGSASSNDEDQDNRNNNKRNPVNPVSREVRCSRCDCAMEPCGSGDPLCDSCLADLSEVPA